MCLLSSARRITVTANPNSSVTQQGVIIITLKSYLDRLAEEERVKVGTQRQVPSFSDLADVAGVDRATISRLASGGFKSLTLKVLVAILDELNRRGFETSLEDIVAYRRPS
jgi:DNA-binding Xre family transcriptional regulator